MYCTSVRLIRKLHYHHRRRRRLVFLVFFSSFFFCFFLLLQTPFHSRKLEVILPSNSGSSYVTLSFDMTDMLTEAVQCHVRRLHVVSGSAGISVLLHVVTLQQISLSLSLSLSLYLYLPSPLYLLYHHVRPLLATTLHGCNLVLQRNVKIVWPCGIERPVFR